MEPECANEGHAHGYLNRQTEYLQRLRRIEGQVRGLQRMVSEEQYCIDIVTQISAVNRALQSVAVGLLEEHVGSCVAEAIQADGPTGPRGSAKIKEASRAIERLIRS